MIDTYREALLAHGDSPAAVLTPKGRQSLRYRSITRFLPKNGCSVLDFGCGLAHLYDHFCRENYTVRYTGCDLIPDFIHINQIKYPTARFILCDSPSKLEERFDFILASGIFSFLYADSWQQQHEFVRSMLMELYDRTNVALSVDFMTKHVDFMQVNSYHEDPGAIFNFAVENLSRRVLLDATYMPYEFCLTVLRQNAIDHVTSTYLNVNS